MKVDYVVYLGVDGVEKAWQEALPGLELPGPGWCHRRATRNSADQHSSKRIVGCCTAENGKTKCPQTEENAACHMDKKPWQH